MTIIIIIKILKGEKKESSNKKHLNKLLPERQSRKYEPQGIYYHNLLFLEEINSSE